jgi:hypothetical protein
VQSLTITTAVPVMVRSKSITMYTSLPISASLHKVRLGALGNRYRHDTHTGPSDRQRHGSQKDNITSAESRDDMG